MKRRQYAVLDEIVERNGNDWIYEYLTEQLFDGVRPSRIAEDLGISYSVLKGWVLEKCPEVFDVARRARADELEWMAMDAIENANSDTIGLAKLKSEHYMKLAGKMDRDTWGDGNGVGKPGDISFRIVIGSTHPELEVNSVNGIDSVPEGDSGKMLLGSGNVIDGEARELVAGDVE